MRVVDLRHRGREHVIGCWRVGDVLVDPGPESTLETLETPPLGVRSTYAHVFIIAETAAGVAATRKVAETLRLPRK